MIPTDTWRAPDSLGRPLLRRTGTALVVAALALVADPALPGASDLPAQQQGAMDRPEIHVGGLLRTGFRIGPGAPGESDGFRLYDARLRADGEIGIVFEWLVQGEFDPDTDSFGLLDARLRLPIQPELALDVGQFKAPFGEEQLQSKGDITFVERSQASSFLAPGRELGVQAHGEFLEGKLGYRAGVFNGSGRSVGNDDDRFLYAARAAYNSVGSVGFYDDLAVELGASVAYSEDVDTDLTSGNGWQGQRGFDFESFFGERLLLGGDARVSYRGYFVRGEYIRAELETPIPISGVGNVLVDETVEGAYVEGGYNLWGAIEGVVRWDHLDDDVLLASTGNPLGGDFVVAGVNLFPGYHTKVGLQYAVGLDGAELGPGIADREFQLLVGVDF